MTRLKALASGHGRYPCNSPWHCCSCYSHLPLIAVVCIRLIVLSVPFPMWLSCLIDLACPMFFTVVTVPIPDSSRYSDSQTLHSDFLARVLCAPRSSHFHWPNSSDFTDVVMAVSMLSAVLEVCCLCRFSVAASHRCCMYYVLCYDL